LANLEVVVAGVTLPQASFFEGPGRVTSPGAF